MNNIEEIALILMIMYHCTCYAVIKYFFRWLIDRAISDHVDPKEAYMSNKHAFIIFFIIGLVIFGTFSEGIGNDFWGAGIMCGALGAFWMTAFYGETSEGSYENDMKHKRL